MIDIFHGMHVAVYMSSQKRQGRLKDDFGCLCRHSCIQYSKQRQKTVFQHVIFQSDMSGDKICIGNDFKMTPQFSSDFGV